MCLQDSTSKITEYPPNNNKTSDAPQMMSHFVENVDERSDSASPCGTTDLHYAALSNSFGLKEDKSLHYRACARFNGMRLSFVTNVI